LIGNIKRGTEVLGIERKEKGSVCYVKIVAERPGKGSQIGQISDASGKFME